MGTFQPICHCCFLFTLRPGGPIFRNRPGGRPMLLLTKVAEGSP